MYAGREDAPVLLHFAVRDQSLFVSSSVRLFLFLLDLYGLVLSVQSTFVIRCNFRRWNIQSRTEAVRTTLCYARITTWRKYISVSSSSLTIYM